jgi:hypothetical protein
MRFDQFNLPTRRLNVENAIKMILKGCFRPSLRMVNPNLQLLLLPILLAGAAVVREDPVLHVDIEAIWNTKIST